MTTLPTQTNRKLGLVIDLDTCVGCHACVISCKGWNTENYGAPLSDQDAYGGNPSGTFLNRVHSYEMQPEQGGAAQLPVDFVIRQDENVIAVEVFFAYEPMLVTDVMSAHEVYNFALFRPRFGSLAALQP